MFTINEDGSIYATRGDIVFFKVSALKNGGYEPYIFKIGDVVRIKVFERKTCKNVVLQKDFVIEEEGEEMTIFLEGDETKLGDIINKPKDYWYEIELNPETYPQTIVGYDDDGEKIFKLFPEGGMIKE